MRLTKALVSFFVLSQTLLIAQAQTSYDYYGATSSNYCPTLYSNIQIGSTDGTSGGQVSAVQRFLIARGYLAISSPTGTFGGMTYAAVKNFQYTNSIQTTGTVGPLTRAAIASLCGGSYSSTGSGSYQATNSTNNYTTQNVSQPTLSVNFSATSITPGGYVVITWNATNATSCTFRNMNNGASESISTSGTRYISPTETRTYQIDCSNGYLTATKSGTIYVQSYQYQTQTQTQTQTTTQQTATPSLTIIGQTTDAITGQYSNLPFNTRIALVNTFSNAELSTPVMYTNTSYGTASFSLSLSGVSSSAYILRAVNGYQTLAESTGFAVKVNQKRNFVNGLGQAACNADIVAALGYQVATCSIGGGCDGANPGIWGACLTGDFTQTPVTGPQAVLTQSKSSTTQGESYSVSWTSSYSTSCTFESSVNGATWVYEGAGTNNTLNFASSQLGTYTGRLSCTGASGTTPFVTTLSHSVTASTSVKRNFVHGEGQVACNALIVSTYGYQAATCSVGGGCDGLNPGLWGACVGGTSSTPVTSNPTAAAPTQTQLIVSPTTVSMNQNFTATWSGNNSPTSYNIKIDNTVYPQSGTTWTGTPVSLGLGAGSHTIQAQSCNIVGCSTYSGAYTVTVTGPETRNFVHGEGQTACNALIVSTYGSQVATCSVGGGCSGLNPGLWGACVTR